MKVSIKEFGIKDLSIGSTGIEFEVRSPQGEFIGDCVLTMTGIIWCKGKTDKDNGVKVSWTEFITLCASEDALAAGLGAAKALQREHH